MEIIIIIGLILLNGIFSMSEMSVVASKKYKLEKAKKKGKNGANVDSSELIISIKQRMIFLNLDILDLKINTLKASFLQSPLLYLLHYALQQKH